MKIARHPCDAWFAPAHGCATNGEPSRPRHGQDVRLATPFPTSVSPCRREAPPGGHRGRALPRLRTRRVQPIQALITAATPPARQREPSSVHHQGNIHWWLLPLRSPGRGNEGPRASKERDDPKRSRTRPRRTRPARLRQRAEPRRLDGANPTGAAEALPTAGRPQAHRLPEETRMGSGASLIVTVGSVTTNRGVSPAPLHTRTP